MKPKPYRELKSAFPGQNLWDYGYLFDDDGEDSAWAIELADHLACTEEIVSFDTETTSLDVREAGVVAVSFAARTNDRVWASTLCFMDGDPVPEWLEDWIEDPTKQKVMANAKYDYSVLKQAWDLTLRGVVCDTMILDQVLNDEAVAHGVDLMSETHLELKKIPTHAILGKGKDFTGWGPVPRSALATYANEDVIAVLMLFEKLWPLAHDVGLGECLALEMEVLPVVAEMEMAGVAIDLPLLGELNTEFTRRQEAALADARKIAQPLRDLMCKERTALYEKIDAVYEKYPRGKAPDQVKKLRLKARTAMRSAAQPVNLGSPAQLQDLLYNRWQLHRKLGLRHPPKTKKGNPCTDNDTLVKLEPYSEFVQALLKHRKVAKLVSTYTGKIPGLIAEKTGRLHGSFWQVGARTGRFTSSDPNLQNIPNRSDEGRLIRTAFVPAEGMILWAADYSQIEPRVAAHLSGETVWLDAYNNGEDLYIATAKAIWGAIAEEALGGRRQLAKTVVLAALYGAGPTKIATTAGIPFEEACDLLDAFWAAVPELRAYMDSNIAYARKHGVIWTMNQLRRRHMPDMNHRWSGRKKAAENQAGNTPVQGTAADILKRAMVRLAPSLPTYGAILTLQVHDELVGECPIDAFSEFKPVLVEAMEGAAELRVPLKVEVASGTNWAEAH